MGTGRSLLKLTFGGKRGIKTAGNGAAMRAPIIGCFFAAEDARRLAFVESSTRLTHRDPRALIGAQSAALAASLVARDLRPKNLDSFRAFGEATPYEEEWMVLMTAVESGLEQKLEPWEFCKTIGISGGVTGYVFETIPVVLFSWLRYSDREEALVGIWQCGGDTDSTGSILGGILYACETPPPTQWLAPVVDYPLSIAKLKQVGECLDQNTKTPDWSFILFFLRNLIVFPLVLAFALFVMLPKKYTHVLRAKKSR